MKKMILRMSRRERIYLIAGTAVLLFGVVVYPATKKAAAFRQEQIDVLEDEIALREDFRGFIADEFAIELENELLRDTLGETDGLLFPPIDNPIMLQSRMIQLFNEMGPDLELEVSAGRSSISDAATQVNLSIRGRGRYPTILKFLHKLEMYRPVIIVDTLTMAGSSKGRGRPGSRDPRDRRGPFGQPQPQKPTTEPTTEPTLQLRLLVHINCEEAGGGK